MTNLELIINDEPWTVIVVHEKKYPYWAANTKDKTLTVNHNYDLDKAKYQCWLQYQKTTKKTWN